MYSVNFRLVAELTASAENSYKHLRCLQSCMELNGFTAKSAIVDIL